MNSDNISSKLPEVGTTIFSTMSALARQYNAINLSQGFPDFNPDAKLLSAINMAAKNKHHQYALMAGNMKLREKIAAKYNRLEGINIHPEKEITITAGGTQAIFTAIQAIVQPGDEVLMFAPCYDSYAPSVQVAGGTCVYYQLMPPDFRINWTEAEKLITGRTKLIILNSPHNPSGAVLNNDDMRALKNIVEKNSCFLLSDEVYEHIVFNGEKHLSILQNESLRQRGFMVSSFGKTYHTTGWKVGYCIAPDKLTQEFRKIHQFNVFSVNSVAQEAFATILDFPELYEHLSSFYEKKRNYFRSLLANSSFKLLPCQGTYFQLADYSAISHESDVTFCDWLVRQVGVAAIPVSVFYNDKKSSVNLVRFCFAKEDKTLEAAAERLCRL